MAKLTRGSLGSLEGSGERTSRPFWSVTIPVSKSIPVIRADISLTIFDPDRSRWVFSIHSLSTGFSAGARARSRSPLFAVFRSAGIIRMFAIVCHDQCPALGAARAGLRVSGKGRKPRVHPVIKVQVLQTRGHAIPRQWMRRWVRDEVRRAVED
jgi:hypothetical protein